MGQLEGSGGGQGPDDGGGQYDADAYDQAVGSGRGVEYDADAYDAVPVHSQTNIPPPRKYGGGGGAPAPSRGGVPDPSSEDMLSQLKQPGGVGGQGHQNYVEGSHVAADAGPRTQNS